MVTSSSKGDDGKNKQGRGRHDCRGQKKNNTVRPLGDGVFLGQHLDDIGQRLEQSELPGPVGTIADLHPPQQLSFCQGQVSGDGQQTDQHHTQLDQ